MAGNPQNVSSEPIASMGMRPGSTQNPQTTWMTGAGWLTTEAASKIKEWFESTDPVAVQRAGSYYLAAEGSLNRFAHDFKQKAIELAEHYKGPTAKTTQEQLRYFHASVRELADKFGEVGRPLQDYAQTLARAQQDIKTSDDLGFFEGVPFKRMHDLENKAKDLLKKVNEEIVQHYDRLPRSIQQAMPDPNLNGDTPPFQKIDMSPFDSPNFDPNSVNSTNYDPNALNPRELDPKNFDTGGINDGGVDTRPIKTDGFNTGPTDPGRLNDNGLNANGNGIDPNSLSQRGMGDNSFDTSGLNPNGLNPNGMNPNDLNPNGLDPNGLNPNPLNDRTGLANYVPNIAPTDPNALNTSTGYGTSGTGTGSGYGSGGVGNGTTAATVTRGTGMNGAPFMPMNAHPGGAQKDGQANRNSPLYEDDDVYTGGGPDTIASNIDHRTV
ncbi:hypothetical protein [Nonomuraea sp. B19D2]|uniref:hypothetical protein n=1 Tax=Nonomuraea sp. B19D2 TaxID=3159561 RepID=UPI0032DA13F0